jgi:hypothetical protein
MTSLLLLMDWTFRNSETKQFIFRRTVMLFLSEDTVKAVSKKELNALDTQIEQERKARVRVANQIKSERKTR